VSFVYQGPVEPSHGRFVGRSAELALIEDWLRSVRCVGAILGARQTGKTSLLLRSREIAGDRYGMVFVNLEAVQGVTPEVCFAFIADEMRDQLGSTSQTAEGAPQDGPSFLRFLRILAESIQRPRVGVLLDEVGALPASTGERLAHTLRASFTSRHVKPGLDRYLFVLSGSTDLLELTTGHTSPLKNVTESVYLGDLSEEDVRGLLREGFRAVNATLTATVEATILKWGGGHPYWTQLLGGAAATAGAADAHEADRIALQLVEREERNLPHLRRVLDQAPRDFGATLDRLLSGESIPFRRHDPMVAGLELCGVLKDVSGRCSFRNRIYEEALRQWRADSPKGKSAAAFRLRRSLSVFVSYAHEDEKLRAELGKHLSVLERQGLISTWHDRMITGGEEWAGTVDAHLEEAQIILLLVSADFVNSRYCYDVEMTRAIERHESKEALVIPIVLRPVLLHGLPFSAFQTLPRDARPVTDWPSLDSALVDVTDGLRAAIERMLSR
jgi:TIR domain